MSKDITVQLIVFMEQTQIYMKRFIKIKNCHPLEFLLDQLFFIVRSERGLRIHGFKSFNNFPLLMFCSTAKGLELAD